MRNRVPRLVVAGIMGLAAVLSLCGFPRGTAQAGNIPYSLSLTPFAGGYVFEGNRNLADRPVYGLAAGFNFTPNWGIEAVYSGIFDIPSTNGTQTELTINSVRGDFLYHFLPEQSFVPYVAVGAGVMFLDPRQGATDRNPMVDYGVGFKYFLTDYLALRADVRHVFEINVNDTATISDYFNHLAYTGGVTFQIGGVKPATRTVEVEKPVKAVEAPVPAPEAAKPAPPPAPVVEPPPAPKAEPAPAPAPEPAPVAAAVPEKAPEPVAPVPPPAEKIETAAVPKAETTVTRINIRRNAVEIVATRGIRVYKTFRLSSPSRLVIDISGAENGLDARWVPVNRLGISDIRIGTYEGRLRIVLDAAGSKLPEFRIVKTKKGLKVVAGKARRKK